MKLNKNLEQKLNNIISFLKDKKVIIAFSGGVDSSLLAFLSKKFAKEVLLVTERSILYPDEEIDEASQFAESHEIPHLIIERNPLDDKQFQCNPQNRCYLCKKGLYSDIIHIKESKGFDIILDGSNFDDLDDFRPGMQAVKELGIVAPYLDFKVNKQDIRDISEFYKLKVYSKPSMACFSSRIPYGQVIDEEKLNRIRAGEKFLKQTFNLKQLRVRHHENNLARIEFLKEDFPLILKKENLIQIKKQFKEIGFNYITIDIEGFRSGSMNEVLNLEEI